MAKRQYTKQEIVKYVSEVADLEKRIYILSEARILHLSKAKQILHEAENECDAADYEHLKAENTLQSNIDEIKRLNTRESFDPGAFFKNFKNTFFKSLGLLFKPFSMISQLNIPGVSLVLGFLYFSLLLMGITFVGLGIDFLFYQSIFYQSNNLFVCIPLGCIALPFIMTVIGLVVQKISDVRRKKQAISSANICKEKNIKHLKNTEAIVATKNRERELITAEAGFLLEQAKICENAANEINKVLQKSYESTNIIRADFRFIDCVIILDFAFRNDLCDTVREGIQYYETKTFRNQTIRGIKNLCAQINALHVSVRGIRKDLQAISSSIDKLVENSNESLTLFNKSIANQEASLAIQEKSLHTQERILSNTEATRYSAESIQTSLLHSNVYL